MLGLWSDLRLAVRLLAKDRRYTFAAVVALGLGIGLNTSVFSIINAFVRELPFDQPQRLIAIQLRDARVPVPGRDRGLSAGGVITAPSYADLREWREHTSAFEGLAATRGGGVLNLSDDGLAAERLNGSYITANTFRVLRVTPILGRDFVEDDDRPGAAQVLMLGYDLWQTRYAGDRAVVGRSVRVNDVPATIIGVMPSGFKYPFVDQAWQSISSSAGFTPSSATRNLSILGRLKPSVDLPSARAELEAIVSARPETYKDLVPFARPLRELYPQPPPTMFAIIGAVGFVWLIACANLANLQLARSVSRAREIAVRTAVGASRLQIVRQLLIECLMVAAGGAALGLILSIYGANEIAKAFEPIQAGIPLGSNRPYWLNLSPDATVLLFVAVLTIISALAFGLLPAWQISKTDVHETLKDEGRAVGGGVRGRRWSAALLTTELALALILLAGAGLMWRDFIDRYREETVIDTTGIVTMRLTLPAQKYPTPENRKRFLEQLNQRLSAMTVFSAVSMASHVPLEFGAPARELYIDGVELPAGEKPPIVSYMLTGGRYFETLKVPIVRGRAIEAIDGRTGQEGVVVDERFAARFFENGDAIGRRIRLGAKGVWYTIVGVARTVPQFGPAPEIRPVVYAPLQAEPAPDGRAAIIVKGPLHSASAALREEVRAMDSSLPLFAVETLETTRARGRLPQRMLGIWFGTLAVVGLILSSVGVFAITAHNVARRTHEIGVRMALGADAREVIRMFMRRTVIQLAIGIVLGLAGALAVGRVLQSSLRDVGDRDPITLTIVTAVLAIVTLVATLLPARRATRVDPMVALRD